MTVRSVHVKHYQGNVAAIIQCHVGRLQFILAPIFFLHLNVYACIILSMNTSKAPVESCLSLGIRKANRVMSQIYDQHLADCNLRSTQYSILRVLYHRGEATGRDLRNFLVLDQSTMSRNLKPLLRDGFIVQSEGEDRREKPLKLTSKGRTLHKKAAPLWKRHKQK